MSFFFLFSFFFFSLSLFLPFSLSLSLPPSHPSSSTHNPTPAQDDGWINTGDLGYADDDGFLWMLGRFSHTLYFCPEDKPGSRFALLCSAVEAMYSVHAAVDTCALVPLELHRRRRRRRGGLHRMARITIYTPREEEKEDDDDDDGDENEDDSDDDDEEDDDDQDDADPKPESILLLIVALRVGVNVGDEIEFLATEIADAVEGSVWDSVLRETGLLGDDSFRHVLFYDEDERFPTDFRHNSKIDRKALAKWARKTLDSSPHRL